MRPIIFCLNLPVLSEADTMVKVWCGLLEVFFISTGLYISYQLVVVSY
jgi:hypothetical protein